LNQSTVTAVLDERYPGRERTAVEQVAVGNRRQTAVVRFADERPVVVQCSPAVESLRIEATLTEAIRRQTAVPVPPALDVGTHDGTGYAVRSYRPGEDLHTTFTALSSERRRRVAETFGRYLGELHAAFAFDGSGELTAQRVGPAEDGVGIRGDDRSLVAPAASSRRWLRSYGCAAVGRLPAAFDSLRDRLLDCLRTASVPSCSRPRLFPWDLRPGNALVAENEISAVVDWERPLAADPALAVAKTEYLVADWYGEDPTALRDAFRDGYESVRPYPDVRPVHRIAAVADTAVDSRGVVTTPGYPELGRDAAVDFHRSALSAALPGEQ